VVDSRRGGDGHIRPEPAGVDGDERPARAGSCAAQACPAAGGDRLAGIVSEHLIFVEFLTFVDLDDP
jgi:hypothetical protein